MYPKPPFPTLNEPHAEKPMNVAARQIHPQHRGPTLVHSTDDVQTTAEQDRSIGEIIRQTKNLGDEQVNAILEFQRSSGVRFGEAAVALGLATDSDIVFALSQQFHYP